MMRWIMQLLGRRGAENRERERALADAFYLHHLRHTAQQAAHIDQRAWGDLMAEGRLERWVHDDD